MAEKRERKSEEAEEGEQHLQDDIITQKILPKLPIKALTQCKVISKQVCSSLSSPNLVLDYSKQALFAHPGPPLESVIIQCGTDLYLYSCVNDDNIPEYDDYIEEINGGSNFMNCNLVKLDAEFEFDRLVGSSNGLVCLGGTRGLYFILYNPKTNESHKYYPCDYDILNNLFEYDRIYLFYHNHHDPYVGWGFGYVSSVDDYKVVRIMLMVDKDEYAIAHVFSLKTNSWKKVRLDFFTDGLLLGAVQEAKADETLYWNRVAPDGRFRTLGFDLASETFHWFPDLRINSINQVLCQMGGCLAKFRSNASNEVILDIAKSPGRVVSVCLACDFRIDTNDRVIGFTKTGKIFVARSYGKRISVLDCSSKRTLLTLEGAVRHMETQIKSYNPAETSPLPPTSEASSSTEGTWADSYRPNRF